MKLNRESNRNLKMNEPYFGLRKLCLQLDKLKWARPNNSPLQMGFVEKVLRGIFPVKENGKEEENECSSTMKLS